LRLMRETLDVATIVPGHGPIGNGPEATDTMIEYLQWLQTAVAGAQESGQSPEEAVQSIAMPPILTFPSAAAHSEELNANNEQMHRLNVLAAYHALDDARS